jgi:glycylpeptide N-tetradecanoyltransferase|tara:strand:- start:1102 stop:2136 length:1035 start_codon:yes stop_codon:yes gene_type:complete
MHEFWDKQPVPREGVKMGEIESNKQVSSTPLNLGEGFTWSTCTLEEARTFLECHYFDEGDTFKFNYTRDILEWSTEVPGCENIVIRANGNIVGYISSVPLKLKIEDKVVNAVQINFLCVHLQFRSSRFAPLLIGEIKRRANMRGIWQAIYTATTKIPTPITKSEYWHRFLNVKHLVNTDFFKTDRLREKYYEVRGPCKYIWRKMTTKDIPKVTTILKEYLKDSKLSVVVDSNYVKQWLLPIHTYVNDDSNDLISFYDVPYDRCDNNGTVKQVYKFYIAGDVYNDAFLIAKNLKYDVFNILDVGINTDNLEKLKCMKGTGHVYYYLFNWNLRESINREKIDIILP